MLIAPNPIPLGRHPFFHQLGYKALILASMLNDAYKAMDNNTGLDPNQGAFMIQSVVDLLT
jgi:hypothetical protein